MLRMRWNYADRMTFWLLVLIWFRSLDDLLYFVIITQIFGFGWEFWVICYRLPMQLWISVEALTLSFMKNTCYNPIPTSRLCLHCDLLVCQLSTLQVGAILDFLAVGDWLQLLQISLMWGWGIVTESHLNKYGTCAEFTRVHWIICHNRPHFWVLGWNLGYFTWGCKCSSGLFWKAWPCSTKTSAAILPGRVYSDGTIQP